MSSTAHCLTHTPSLMFVVVRSTIEEEYAKRLAKLAKMQIGKDEIGYAL